MFAYAIRLIFRSQCVVIKSAFAIIRPYKTVLPLDKLFTFGFMRQIKEDFINRNTSDVD